ncbi:MAG: hypothetical protein KDI06_08090 [Calditrichaeota bacterium]|nr:hypothetical protein [Calditrichota bacterium]
MRGGNRRMWWRVVWAVSLMMALSACGDDDQPLVESDPDNARPDCRECQILFIGSSYLSYYGNDLVDIFNAFAAEAGKPVYAEKRSIGGYRLYRHIASEGTLAKIRERNWDYIILQGNAAFLSREEWHPMIIPYLIEFRQIIKENNPQTCVIYMMPWAYKNGLLSIPGGEMDYQEMQTALYNETIRVVNENDIATAPVGWAWYTAIVNGYEGDLYLTDNNHQSASGAYLAASVFYSTIFQEEAPDIPFSWGEGDNPPYLRAIADSLVRNFPDLWNLY